MSGDCAREHQACSKRFDGIWKRAGCEARCATYRSCSDACTGDDTSACLDRCGRVAAPGGKACRSACEKLEGRNDGSADLCILKCYEKAPCDPDLCREGPR